MNAVINFMNTAFDFVIKAMVSNINATQWIISMLIVASIGLLISKRRGGFMLLTLSVSASAWLTFKTGHAAISVQQIVILMFCAYDFFGLTIVVRNKNVK